MKTIKQMFWRKSVLVSFAVGVLLLLIGLAIDIVRDGNKFCIVY